MYIMFQKIKMSGPEDKFDKAYILIWDKLLGIERM
jgi:hypothetical protein